MAKLSLSSAWVESRGVLRHDGNLLAIVALALIALPSTVQAMITPAAPSGEAQSVRPPDSSAATREKRAFLRTF